MRCLKRLSSASLRHRKGDSGYADWVIVTLHGLREHLDHPYRRLLDVLREMPGIVAELGLTVEQFPDFTTVCARMQELRIAVWRGLLRLSTVLHNLGDAQAIDATGFDPHSANGHYANRVDYPFKSVKITVVVDCDTSVILDVHCSMKQHYSC